MMDPVHGVPIEDITCPSCAKKYGSRNAKKVCRNCEECGGCCTCHGSVRDQVSHMVFIDELKKRL